MSCCPKEYTCFCSLEDGIRFLWNRHDYLLGEMPSTEDVTTNRFDTEGTMYGKCSHYAYLQDVGEVSSTNTNVSTHAAHQYRLFIISCDKTKRDTIANYVYRYFGSCPEVQTEEGNISAISPGRAIKSYDSEECVFVASMSLTVSYSVRRQCCLSI